jgi:hypothetical protein
MYFSKKIENIFILKKKFKICPLEKRIYFPPRSKFEYALGYGFDSFSGPDQIMGPSLSDPI